ncbi:3-hydroxyacyl-CoA dehydrogenase [Pelosinus propionicus]|uniref:3-hydroxybutyryl-CoA dehydrogenase n=1 Tax=Pelosinus propionicus DSM 13327 TaxID=1123291 RepID=A0A1I4PIL3_9FIRM|nr:3-hydroxyacyl-CoA dehydrogenase [Pelosinus propionicus]SFM27484.1 3-hydroxybutyryl-CoA dehydrogenase [Pelosinus propionicus DSM 13327]
MNYKNITIAGSGVLGSQIAFQTAYKGFTVSVYDINQQAIDTAKERLHQLKLNYMRDLKASEQEVNRALERISFFVELSEAVNQADLLIEVIPEQVAIKMNFYTKLSKVASEKTVFATNSSTLLPSMFAEVTGRPEKFLALHFANQIWLNNTAEIMRHSKTDQGIFEEVVEFTKAIGMISLPIYKEQPGYILNSLLVPLLNAALTLNVKEIADYQTIDKAWMVGTGADYGPFAILDIVGIRTVHNIVLSRGEAGDEKSAYLAQWLKTQYLEKGKEGKETGEGFYKYPNPAFLESNFLTM